MIQGVYNKTGSIEQSRRLFECRCCQGMVYAPVGFPLPTCPHCQHSEFQILAEPVASTVLAVKWMKELIFIGSHYTSASDH